MTTTATDYNGYKNRATWNIALWLNNDEGLYRTARAHAQDAHKRGYYLTGMAAKNLCRDLFGGVTPDGIKLHGPGIDWKAIAEVINEMAD